MIVCLQCGETADRHPQAMFCFRCVRKRENHPPAVIARAAVALAIERGLLPAADSLACADCPAPAAVYDHRDYSKPLDVAAVCKACNSRRGPALGSLARRAEILDERRALRFGPTLSALLTTTTTP